jgi:hypothetical protein
MVWWLFRSSSFELLDCRQSIGYVSQLMGMISVLLSDSQTISARMMICNLALKLDFVDTPVALEQTGFTG